jgi:Domain of unknown function (DUF4169)
VNAEIINLRRVKKTLARKEAEQQAEANRKKFGRSKNEKSLTTAKEAQATKLLDGHKRDT